MIEGSVDFILRHDLLFLFNMNIEFYFEIITWDMILLIS